MSKFDLDDIRTLEEGEDAGPEEQAMALQRAINNGMWGLQGSYGRSMMGAIEAGSCMLGTSPAHDYYGNRIPARHEVKAGTKGSREFVVERHGEEWAVMLEAA